MRKIRWLSPEHTKPDEDVTVAPDSCCCISIATGSSQSVPLCLVSSLSVSLHLCSGTAGWGLTQGWTWEDVADRNDPSDAGGVQFFSPIFFTKIHSPASCYDWGWNPSLHFSAECFCFLVLYMFVSFQRWTASDLLHKLSKTERGQCQWSGGIAQSRSNAQPRLVWQFPVTIFFFCPSYVLNALVSFIQSETLIWARGGTIWSYACMYASPSLTFTSLMYGLLNGAIMMDPWPRGQGLFLKWLLKFPVGKSWSPIKRSDVLVHPTEVQNIKKTDTKLLNWEKTDILLQKDQKYNRNTTKRQNDQNEMQIKKNKWLQSETKQLQGTA